VADYFEHGQERLGSIKCEEWRDQLRNCELEKNDRAAWSY
jgi:hypothetical protein